MDFEAALASCPERFCGDGERAIAYRESGAGPALVLLHGISSGAASWAAQLANLGSDFRVVAWDAPGYGRSAPLAQAVPTAADYATALERLVDGLALDAFVLVGHSLGALMAAAYAAAHPQRVARLVLLSPARGYADADAAEREDKFARRMAMLDRLGPEGLARERAPALLSSAAPVDAIAWAAWNTRRITVAGYRQAARMLADDAIARYAGAFHGPVAVVSGSEDTITPVERCRAVASMFEHGTYASLPGLGHASYLEDPARINAILRAQVLAGSETEQTA